MTEDVLVEALREYTAEGVEFVLAIPVGSAERIYAQDYIAWRVMGGTLPAPRPERSYGLGSRVLEVIREAIDDRLPEPMEGKL
jgi:hypothetical protein